MKKFNPDFEKDSTICPFCGSEDIESSGLPEFTAYDEVRVPIHCNDCDGYWVDVYQMTGRDY